MNGKLWRFIDNQGSFESYSANKIKSLYFPLCNEAIMSSITPDLHGDIKTSQNSFLLEPVSRIDLVTSRSSRNFWVYLDKDKAWSASGVSKNLAQIKEDKFRLEAGLLWHKIIRENKKIGLKAEILSFVPASGEPVEIMQVKLTNISGRKIRFVPTAAIPIYARGASNLRDHRHVTSLLQRITLYKFGVISKPTLSFDEAGHTPNKNLYFVLGQDEKCLPPEYLYPTQELFCGEQGDLEAPESVLENLLPSKTKIQGKEAMGGLRFREVTLAAGGSRTYIILLGITEDKFEISALIRKFNTPLKVRSALEDTKRFWVSLSKKIELSTGNRDFDNWFRWVSVQPALRRIFGCSFLPDFDYGKGGRGWRDLWQDCLGLILTEPQKVRQLLINNFSGVRPDGSNATIIGKKSGEFIADRNNISRIWMDHGVWPLLSLDLYINETGDKNILFAEAPYFCDRQILGNRTQDKNHGTILEHLLVQNLVRFFKVGRHNIIRLEGADWNDGLDMAKENGESVAFSAMYAHNLLLLAQLLRKSGKARIKTAKELKILLKKVNYNDIKAKLKNLEVYLAETKLSFSGEKVAIDSSALAGNLEQKAKWLMQHIRKQEWLKEGFFNGYYDNKKERVEGRKKGIMRMMLASQVFPILSGVAAPWQVEKAVKSINRYLLDKKSGGFHLNTDFKEEQHDLGRAFSFIYGDKENGAFFNHMVVMYAYALYKRGFIKEGWQALSSIYNMAIDTCRSKIYPCLPEYFNLEGRGMYSYLTGSASWFVLTLVSEVFGLKGKEGNLLIEPKLLTEHFRNSSIITVRRIFAAKPLEVTFRYQAKNPSGCLKILRASLNSLPLTLENSFSIKVRRSLLSGNRLNELTITLG